MCVQTNPIKIHDVCSTPPSLLPSNFACCMKKRLENIRSPRPHVTDWHLSVVYTKLGFLDCKTCGEVL